MIESFDERPVFATNRNSPARIPNAICYIDKNGFTINNRSNVDASLQIAKNSSVKILHTTFRTECDKSLVRFENYVPVFIDIGNKKINYNQILNSDLYINGMQHNGICMLSGSTYRIRYPKSFGAIKFANNKDFYIEINHENDDLYYSYDVRNSAVNVVTGISFANLPSVNIKLSCIKMSSYSNTISMNHFLNFYDFILDNEQWYLSAPKNLTITYDKKTSYSYFKTAGDSECFYINGYDSPILIFEHNKVYTITNSSKKERPFYFDTYPEGMLKYPYQDFDNDINTDRSNLFIIFNGSGSSFSYAYQELSVDPYFSINANSNPAYDPDSIYYACSSKKYFGNKILVGKRRIAEVVGFYGRYAPESKSIQFSENGDQYIYDVMYHMCGHILPISVVDLENKTIDSVQDIGILKLSQKESKIISKEDDVIYYNLIGDIFESVDEVAYYVFNKNKFQKSLSGSTIVISLSKELIDIAQDNKKSIVASYEKLSGNPANFKNDFILFFESMIKYLKRNGAFEVLVKIT